jgi:hypothetical protein
MFRYAWVAPLLIWASACTGSSTPTAPSTSRIIGLSGNLAFGNVTVGQSARATLTITNSGNSTLTISGMTIPCSGCVVYTPSWASGTIPAGGSQQVTQSFTPTAAQNYSGTLTVSGDQTSGTSTIAMSGTGVAPGTGVSQFDGTYSGNWSGGQSDGRTLTGTLAMTLANGEMTGTIAPISGSIAALSGTVSTSGEITARIPAGYRGCSVSLLGQVVSASSGAATATGTYSLLSSPTCNIAFGTWIAARTP